MEFDKLAWSVMLNPLATELPLTQRLRGALQHDANLGVLHTSSKIERSMLAGTLHRKIVGDRSRGGLLARSYRVSISSQPDLQYAHIIALTKQGNIAYTSLMQLYGFADMLPRVQQSMLWNLHPIVSCMLRWYGFLPSYLIGIDVQFKIDEDLWRNWTQEHRNQTLTSVRRLARDYRAISLETPGQDWEQPTHLSIVTRTRSLVYEEIMQIDEDEDEDDDST